MRGEDETGWSGDEARTALIDFATRYFLQNDGKGEAVFPLRIDLRAPRLVGLVRE